MSPKATEGVAARRAPTSSPCHKGVESSRTDPIWPAGHLPLKGETNWPIPPVFIRRPVSAKGFATKPSTPDLLQ